jgi:transcription antitermination protein NusB
MPLDKHQERTEFMHLLYQLDFYDFQLEPLSETLKDSDLNERFHLFFSYKHDIDAVIEEALTNYRLIRISMVDRAILRLATFEMKYEELPKEIAINEALELTKVFSNLDDNKQVKFNNKVLDTIAKAI